MEKNTETRLNHLKGELENLLSYIEFKMLHVDPQKDKTLEGVAFGLTDIIDLVNSIIKEQEELEKWRKINT